jgi:peroxiredoxin Q/BCP
MTNEPASDLPHVGDAAPPLVLPDDSGTICDLSAQRGRWVVLFFYPKDFTPGCTTEVCEFRDSSAEFEAAGATVWSISILDVTSKAEFKTQHQLDFPLLADEDHAVAERYGVWIEKQNYGKSYMGIARTTFLVDPDGRIAHVWAKVKPEGHATAVLETLRSTTTSG